VLLGGLPLGWGPVTIARAAGEVVPLRIDCPLLDGESRAALEARARAELALSPLPAGEIAIACDLHSARVGWRAAGGGLRLREVGLTSADGDRNVDSLLSAVHALRFGDALPAEPRLAVTVVPKGAAPPAASAATGPAGPRPLALRLGALAGVYSELWQGSIAGVVEAQAGLRLSWRARWSLALAGGVGRGLETADGVRARTTRAMLSAAYLAGAHLELRLGAEWKSLAPAWTGAGSTPPSAATAAAFLSTRYVMSRDRFRVVAGPQVGLAASPITVTVADRELFSVPRFLIGVSLDVEGDLIR
jgi:hypothetical protein